jgi:hypothetical protein
MATCSHTLSPLRQALPRSCSAHAIMFETSGVSVDVEKKSKAAAANSKTAVKRRLRKKNL